MPTDWLGGALAQAAIPRVAESGLLHEHLGLGSGGLEEPPPQLAHFACAVSARDAGEEEPSDDRGRVCVEHLICFASRRSTRPNFKDS